MDEASRQHVQYRLDAARRDQAHAVRQVAETVAAGQLGSASSWDNLARVVAQGARSAAQIDAYTVAYVALTAEDA